MEVLQQTGTVKAVLALTPGTPVSAVLNLIMTAHPYTAGALAASAALGAAYTTF